MPPKIREASQLNLNWHLFVVERNKQAIPVVTTRMKADGTPVVRHYEIITKSVKATGTWLVQMARNATQRVLNTPLLCNTLVTDTGWQVAPIEVNRLMLSQQLGGSKRTIHNHVAILMEQGLIARKLWHGTRACYELWINPYFVWEEAVEPVENQATVGAKTPSIAPMSEDEIPAIGAILKNERLKLPHMEFLEKKETPESVIAGVEKLPPQESTRNPFSGNGGPQQGSEPVAQATKKLHQGRGAARAAQKAAEAAVTLQALRDVQRRAYSESAWAYSLAMIYNKLSQYQGKTWTAKEINKAKWAIWNGVYVDALNALPEERWDEHHQHVLRRIELASNHLELHPGRWVPLPYAEIRPGKGYFDQENEQGFRGTLAWLKADQERRHKKAVDVALARAVGEMEQRYKLDKRLKVKVPKHSHVHIKTLLQLHTFHYKILKRLGGENALYRFAAKLQVLKIVASAC